LTKNNYKYVWIKLIPKLINHFLFLWIGKLIPKYHVVIVKLIIFKKAPVTLIVNAFQRSCVQAISIWKSSQRLMNSFPTCDFTVVTNLELFWQVDLKSG